MLRGVPAASTKSPNLPCDRLLPSNSLSLARNLVELVEFLRTSHRARAPYQGNLQSKSLTLLSSLSGRVRFSEDIFAGLISLIFIIDGARPLIENFADGVMPLTNAMFEMLLFLLTFGLATYLSHFRRKPWALRSIRNLLANFAVTIALVVASAVAAIYSNETNLRMLQVDADFSPNLVLSDGSKRPWIVNPAGIEKPFPAWAIPYAILPVAFLHDSDVRIGPGKLRPHRVPPAKTKFQRR